VREVQYPNPFKSFAHRLPPLLSNPGRRAALGQLRFQFGQALAQAALFVEAAGLIPNDGGDGRIALDDPVARFIPGFANLKLQDGGAPGRAMTVKDLLRHTAGFTYGFHNRTPIDAAYRAQKIAEMDTEGGLPAMIAQLEKLPPLLKHLKKDHPITLVFIEANEDALLRRYSETRRPHPLGKNFSVRESLSHERALMEPIRKLADVVIETTQFNVHELRHFVTERFKNPDKRPMLVSVVSFGYRYGVPSDADLVLDVRFLPNPHFVPRLRPFTGKDPKVRRYIRSFPQTGEFLRRIEGLLTYLIPHYIREGKSYLTIAFGCTGGKHRSVMLSESVAKSLAKRGYSAKVIHRDIEK